MEVELNLRLGFPLQLRLICRCMVSVGVWYTDYRVWGVQGVGCGVWGVQGVQGVRCGVCRV